jgi:hypothetical protein
MSEADRRHVMRHMGTQQGAAPANPLRTIQNSTREHAIPANPQKAIESSTTPVEPGKGSKKMEGKKYGGFEQLKKDLAATQAGGMMAKAQGVGVPVTQPTEAGELDQATLIAQLKSTKVNPVFMAKSLAPTLAAAKLKIARAMGVDTRAAATTIAAPAAQVPQLTRDQIVCATLNAFNAGMLTKSQAMSIESRINTSDEIPDDLAKALAPFVKSDEPTGSSSLNASYDTDAVGKSGGAGIQRQSLAKGKRKPTSDEIQAKASECLKAGKITGSQAIQIATHCTMGIDCPPDLMKAIGYNDE